MENFILIIIQIHIQFSKYGYSSKVVKYQNNENFIVILRQLHVELDEIGIKEIVLFWVTIKYQHRKQIVEK